MITSGAISVFIGMLPEMKTTEPYSPSARAKASAVPVTQAGRNRRQDDADRVLRRLAPRLAAASSASASSDSITGWTVRTTKGRPMKVRATAMPTGVNATLRPSAASGLAEPSGIGIERGQRDAGDGRGQGERQVDQRVDDPSAREAIADQHPGEDEAEHGIDQRGGERSAEGELVRGQHPGCGGRLPQRIPAERSRLEREGSQRDQHHQAQIEEGEAEGQPEAGQDAVAAFEADHDLSTVSGAHRSWSSRRRSTSWACAK